MGQFALMIVGIVIGGIAGAAIWGVIGSMKSRSIRRKSELNEQIITSVEEKWVEVENLVRLYRSGRLNPVTFRDSLDGKIESINRLFKPGIHQLDIFFVKYTEKLIEEYTAMITVGTPQVSPVTIPASIEEAGSTTRREPIPVAAAPAPEALMEAPFPMREAPLLVQEEEQIISEMTDAAAADNNFQLESFLEMESSSPSAETIAPVVESEEIVGAGDTKSPASDAALDPEATVGIQGVPPLSPEDFAEQQQIMAIADFSVLEDAATFVPSPPPGMESGTFDGQESETILQSPESPFSFAGRVSSEQKFEQLPPPPDLQGETLSPLPPSPPAQHHPPQPFALPSRSRTHMAPQTFTKDEVARPATIYDVEAETIIVDRSTIMGAQRSAQAPLPENDKKSSIGITGEDVSDAFDAFFGPSKK